MRKPLKPSLADQFKKGIARDGLFLACRRFEDNGWGDQFGRRLTPVRLLEWLEQYGGPAAQLTLDQVDEG